MAQKPYAKFISRQKDFSAAPGLENLGAKLIVALDKAEGQAVVEDLLNRVDAMPATEFKLSVHEERLLAAQLEREEQLRRREVLKLGKSILSAAAIIMARKTLHNGIKRELNRIDAEKSEAVINAGLDEAAAMRTPSWQMREEKINHLRTCDKQEFVPSVVCGFVAGTMAINQAVRLALHGVAPAYTKIDTLKKLDTILQNLTQAKRHSHSALLR